MGAPASGTTRRRPRASRPSTRVSPGNSSATSDCSGSSRTRRSSSSSTPSSRPTSPSSSRRSRPTSRAAAGGRPLHGRTTAATRSSRFTPGPAARMRAGLGGDALRMYLRWAADRGLRPTCWRRARERKRGSSRPRSPCARGENAYGVMKAERGAPARPASLRRLAPAPPPSRRSRRAAPSGRHRGRDRRVRPPRRHVPLERAAGSTSTRRTSAVRITHLPTGIVVQCQNERSQTSNKQTALRILRSRLAELEEEKREAELAKERGAAQDIGFGSQIRSACSTRTSSSRTTAPNTRRAMPSPSSTVRDGFVHSYLLAKAAGRVL